MFLGVGGRWVKDRAGVRGEGGERGEGVEGGKRENYTHLFSFFAATNRITCHCFNRL